MEENATRTSIIKAAIPLMAKHGYAGTSMRNAADAVPIKPSVLYYYFSDKAALMRAVRQQLNRDLDEGMRTLPVTNDAAAMLRQRLRFQIDQREAIVCLLQYFMAVKDDFPLQDGGYVPERAYRHMRDIIDRGLEEGSYQSSDPAFDAKILTHLINGFLLEFYPHPMKRTEAEALTERLAQFIERSLQGPA